MNRSIRLIATVPKAHSTHVSRGFATKKDVSSLKPERKLLLDTFDKVTKEYAWVSDPNTNVYKKVEDKIGKEAAAKMKADIEAKAVAHFNSNLSIPTSATTSASH